MGNPALARSTDDGRRFYVFGEPPEAFWSVTTIIGGGVPKYLHAHYAKLAAELAFDALLERGPHSRAGAIVRRLAARGRAHVAEIQADGGLKSIKLNKLTDRDLALRWIKGAAERRRDALAKRGTDVHGEAEQLVLEHARAAARLHLDRDAVRAWPEELAGFERAFTRWIGDWHPVFVAAEATVFNVAQAYAGTLDAIVRIPAGELLAMVGGGDPLGMSAWEEAIVTWLRRIPADELVTLIVDFKTGTAVYSEVALQLASYARADFIGAPDRVTRVELPQADLGAVLHLRPDGTYQFRLVRIDGQIFDAFKFAREVFRFTHETARTVLLQDLTPAAAAAAEVA